MTPDPFSSTPAPMQDDSQSAPDNDAGDSSDTPNQVDLPMELLPEGMTVKAGDKLTFCVTGDADENGNIPGYFMQSKTSGGDKSDDDWDDQFRAAMSPRNSDTPQTT